MWRMWNKGKDIKDYYGVGEINFTEEGKKVILYDVKRYEELSEKINEERKMFYEKINKQQGMRGF